MNLFPYTCKICDTNFGQPLEGKCPVCGSYAWGPKDDYYRQLSAKIEARQKLTALVQTKLEFARTDREPRIKKKKGKRK